MSHEVKNYYISYIAIRDQKRNFNKIINDIIVIHINLVKSLKLLISINLLFILHCNNNVLSKLENMCTLRDVMK